jgi:adenine-specific DNA-methyltransferase
VFILLYFEDFQSTRLVKELKLIFGELKELCSSQSAYTYIVNYIIFRIAQDTGRDLKFHIPRIESADCILEKMHKTLDISRYNFNIAISNNLLGKVYEDFLDMDTRKNLGLYYTPQEIINFILDRSLGEADVLADPFVKVLDPACGSGYFLLSAYDMLKEKFKANIENLKNKYALENYSILNNGEEVLVDGSEYWKDENIHYHIIKNCIYGADVDEFGALFTMNSLLFKDLNNTCCNPNIIVCNSLIKWEKVSAENETDLKIFWSKKFDYIVGNPPWVSLSRRQGKKIPDKELLYYKGNYSGNSYLPNLYEFFLERGLELTSSGGVLGFLIPDRFAKNAQFMDFRKRILTGYNIKSILFNVKLDKIMADSMALVIENNFCQDNNVEITNMVNPEFHLLQKDFLKKKYCQFLSYNFDYYRDMLQRFNSSAMKLGDIAVTFTGFIGISKNITDKMTSRNQVPVIKGENIIKYEVRGNKFYELSSSSIIGGTKNMDKLNRKNKILVRKTGNRIIAAIDTQGHAVEQSLYGVILTNDDIRAKYLIAVLNSKLIEWYYLKFLVTNINSTPQLKKTNLDEIPVKCCSMERQMYIEGLVDCINSNSGLKVQELQEKIDEEIFDIYQIKRHEIET